MTNKALIYCRVSSPSQVLEGHGLESQEQRCLSRIKEKSYNHVKTFRDEGISGSLFERPAMKELISYLDQHPEENFLIIFDDLTRFARDVRVHIEMKSQLVSRGATLECLNYDFNDTPEGEFVELIMAGQAQLYRKQNQRQVIQKMQSRTKQGYWCLCPPTGYKFAKTSQGKLIQPIPEVVTVLKEAIEGYASDKFLDQSDVLKFLRQNMDKLHKPSIGFEFVKRILTQILYTGYIKYDEWNVPLTKGQHLGFISLETYEKVQEKLRGKKRILRRTESSLFPLRQQISCKECGKLMTSSNPMGKTKRHYMYTCNNRACPASPKNHTNTVVEEAFQELMKGISPTNKMTELAIAILQDAWKEREKASYKESLQKESQINELQHKIDGYMDLASKAKIPLVRGQYEKKIEALALEIGTLSTGDTNITKEAHLESALHRVKKFIGTPLKFWTEADIKEKPTIMRMIFREAPTYSRKEGFGTPKLQPVFRLCEVSSSENIQLVEMPRVELGYNSENHELLRP